MSRETVKRTELGSYTVGEEIANGVTHGIGAGLAVAGLTLLVVLAVIYGDTWRVVAFSIYGATLVFLYVASTLYHSLQNPKAKRVFRVIDHSAIYLLIAGTYTPFLLVALRNTRGWILLAVVWVLALLGILFKALGPERIRFHGVAAISYIGMGWLCLAAWRDMVARLPANAMMLLAAGGALYMVGLIFYGGLQFRYRHAVWHGFVLAASACHYLAILFSLVRR